MCIHRALIASICSSVLLLVVAEPSHASSIGLSFSRSSSVVILGAGDVSGVSAVAHANWNSVATGFQSGTNSNLSPASATLVDSTGAASGVAVTWMGDTTWSTNNGTSNGDNKMMNGYLDDTSSSGGGSTIAFTNIPYAEYDVYVYVGSDGNGRTGSVSDGTTTYSYTTNSNTGGSFPGSYVQTTDSGGGSPSANYAVFSAKSGSSLTITNTRGSNNVGVHGIQIVETVVIPGLPQVENLVPSAVASSSATANGNLIDNGDGADVATLTVYWGASDGGVIAGSWANTAAGGTRTSPGAFSAPLSGLAPNTNYYYRAFVSNSAGDDWALSSETFRTPAALPTVQNIAASGILGTSATIGGRVTSTGGETPTLVVHYGDNDAGIGTWDSQLDLGAESGAASGGVSGLSPGTTYFFRASASNLAGTAWALSSASFTTTAVTPPGVANSAATGINGTFATLNGEITDAGGDPPVVTAYYGTADGGTLAGSWGFSLPAGKQDGAFSRLVTNLQPTTTYYFRAFAQNAAGGVWAPSSLSFTTPVFVPPAVVINEIHYDEDDKTERAEFIELYNPSDDPVDLSGYYFSDGIEFNFPGGTILAPGGYLVVAEDSATMLSKFGIAAALGPFANGTSLKNSGEGITLRDPAGSKIDEVEYKLGFPWPTVGDEVGSPLASPSIELIDPLLDNDLGGSWRASGFPVATGGGGGGSVALLGGSQSGWRYRKGTSYPAQDGAGKDWSDNGYDDSVDGAWLDGTTVIGYSDGDDTTVLTDMQNSYLSIFLRKEFAIAAGEVPSSILLSCYYDDGAVVYLNGVEVERFSLDGGVIAFPPPEGFANTHEAAWSSTVISGAANYLVEGTNVIAIQCINDDLGSSDLSIDATIVTNPAGGGGGNAPTPGAANSSFASNAPPQIRQVDHTPREPKSGEPVLVTAKITDPDGVASVSLQYQIVEPGDYFCRYLKNSVADPRYEDPSEWTSLAMSDDGSGGDALAADSVFSVALPASLQTNRRLIRYRISSGDIPGTTITVPYGDDPQPNFAYFVYDGTPDWSGVIRSGDTPVNYPGSLMSSIPTYFLLSTSTWVDDSQFGGDGGSTYRWPGTMVYDGKVYDHILYRPRGGGHRFDYGKNFWKFDFSRGHRFEARDRYGRRYETDWDKLNFSSIVQQVGFNHRGEQGLFEGVGFRLFELCGVPACKTHYSQFYVVDQASATGANQYAGDYYGLFLAIEQMDGQYLDEHGLPDGNLYKIEGNSGRSNNQGPTQVSDRSDVNAFISTSNGTPSAQWWQDNFEVENYFSYRTVVEAIHHYDIAYGKNFFYYHNPASDKFQLLPWDLDLTWANNMYGSGNHPFKSKVAQNPAFSTDYQNRVREIIDLLYNSDEGDRLIDEMVRDVWTPDSPSLVSADRRLWDNHPRMNSKDRYYDIANDKDFGGMVQILKNYIVSRGNWMRSELLKQDSSVPTTPAITYSGASGFPSNDLQFTSTAYDSGTGFAAMEWRISEVYNPTTANYVAGEPYIYEIDGANESGELASFNAIFLFPALSARPGQTYRARVRHQDSAGRWSHWSPPVEFLASAPDVTQYVDSLRITELHYHPSAATAGEVANGWSASDFEFIELQNIGPVAVDMTDVRFTKGVDFDFPASLVINPGAYMLVVKNQAAFESRYATGLRIAGEWASDNKLSNGGENLKLSLGSGTGIVEFTYDDIAPWPTEPDGDGFSLTLDRAEQSLPADHADPLAWRASRLTGGTPGTGEHIDFATWAIAHGLGAGASLTDDPDNDGLNHLLEYALASNPIAESSGDLPTANQQQLTVGASSDIYLTLTFRRQVGASDLTYSVDLSIDLASWQSGVAVLISSTSHGDGTATEVWRSGVPVSSLPEQFMRLEVEG